jgi:hypothetical protein
MKPYGMAYHEAAKISTHTTSVTGRANYHRRRKKRARQEATTHIIQELNPTDHV